MKGLSHVCLSVSVCLSLYLLLSMQAERETMQKRVVALEVCVCLFVDSAANEATFLWERCPKQNTKLSRNTFSVKSNLTGA